MPQPTDPLATPVAAVVVLRAPAGRVGAIAEQVAAHVSSPTLDLRGPEVPLTVAMLLDAAAQVAASREDQDELAAAIAQVEADQAVARAEVERRTARLQELRSAARWCEAEAVTAADAGAAVAVAEADLAAALDRVDECDERLAAVAEQRGASDAVLEEAQRRLVELDVVGHSENEVRRDLEAANHAARQANADADNARAEAERFAEELLELDERRAGLEAGRAALLTATSVDTGALTRALEAFDTAPLAPPEPATVALADDLERKLSELEVAPPLSPVAEGALAAAELAADEARAALERLRRPPVPEPPPWWDELTRLHAAVVDAETAAGASRARGSARRRLEAALEAERALLDEVGFETYLDALMAGGRRSSRPDPVALAEAEAHLLGAEHDLSELRTQIVAGADAAALRAAVQRVRALGGALLGIPPALVTPAQLRQPRRDPRLITELARALGALGVPAPADDLVAHARSIVADAASATARLATDDAQWEQLLAAVGRLVPEAEAATARAEEAGRAARAARRRVEVLEAELVNRVRPVVDPTTRAATAAALRDHIAALEARIATAEAEAKALRSAVDDEVAAATAELEARRARLDGLLNGAAGSAQLLGRRLDSLRDPLEQLGELAIELRDAATSLDQDLSRLADTIAASTARRDAARAALAERRAAAGAPSALDRAVALGRLLASGARASDVLEDPMAGLPPAERGPIEAALLAAGAARPITVVSDDDDTAAWAIEQPMSLVTLLSHDALDLPLANADVPQVRRSEPHTSHTRHTR